MTTQQVGREGVEVIGLFNALEVWIRAWGESC